MNYKDIEPNRPFLICHPKGDLTVWRAVPFHSGNVGLEIYFHPEGFWCNPPIDTAMETNATKKIARYGIAYLPNDYVENYKKIPYMDFKAQAEYQVNSARKAKSIEHPHLIPKKEGQS